jgi:hypothetical protein
MSAKDQENSNLSILFGPNHSIAASENASLPQNNNKPMPKNDQINRTMNVLHYNHINNSSLQNTTTLTSMHQHKKAGNIVRLRQPHQPIDPTPLRQQMTNKSLRQTNEPIISTTASSFMQNNKTASSSPQDPPPTSTSNTTTQDPKDQSSNCTGKPNPEPIIEDSKGQNDGDKVKAVVKTYTLGPRKYAFPSRRSDAPWIDPRYDPDLTLAQRLEASTDLPLASSSEYEWKVENEYVELGSWQPSARHSRGWKGMGE